MKYYLAYSKKKWARWADHSEPNSQKYVKCWHLACNGNTEHLFDAQIVLKNNGHYELNIPKRTTGSEPIRKRGTIEEINDSLRGLYPTLRLAKISKA